VKSQKISVLLAIFLTVILFISSSIPANALDSWEKGDEKNYTGGRTFEEEFWVADHTNTTKEGKNLTSSIFYMNNHNVQAFLVAINEIRNETNVGTLPYQLFGLHYYSPKGQEVFIGAIFAFLLGYNNTKNPEQGVPDEGEQMFYILPFGAGDLVKGKYIPTVDRSLERIDDKHYVFKISYKNMYAIVTQNPFWGAILKTGWIARFTELTFRYKITLDTENGEVKAETFYDIGQVMELWAVILGIPIQVDVTQIPDTLGLAAVHYVATFTSYSRVAGVGSGNTIQTGITKEANENLTIETKDKERVFDIGFRGIYDVLDETKNPPEKMQENEKAINILLKARLADHLLVGYQLGFSADLMSVMSYGISDNLQDRFQSPRDLKQKSLLNFHMNNLWYAVAFPEWDGYRIEHDPVYTAYTSFEAPEEDKDGDDTVCAGTFMVIFATTACVTVIGFKKKRRL
jgi:hypothetical protein